MSSPEKSSVLFDRTWELTSLTMMLTSGTDSRLTFFQWWRAKEVPGRDVLAQLQHFSILLCDTDICHGDDSSDASPEGNHGKTWVMVRNFKPCPGDKENKDILRSCRGTTTQLRRSAVAADEHVT